MQKILPILLAVALTPTLRADWIEMKDGSRIEGIISSVTPEEIVIGVQTSPTIRDEKSISRADIAKYQRATEDDLLFEEITAINLPDTADSLDAFENPLGEKVRKFMEDYPYSKHMAAARKLVATIDAEKARIEAGEVKVDGQWVSAEEKMDETGELDARIQLAQMQQASSPTKALQIFAIIEKERNTTASYPEAVRLALEQIKALSSQLKSFRTNLDYKMKQQAEGLALAGPEQLALLKQGIEQEKAAAQAAIENARKQNLKWPPLIADSKALDDLERTISSETSRLSALNLDAMETGSASAREAETQIASGELEVARESIAQAEKLWPQYVRLRIIKESFRNAENTAREAAKKAAAQPIPAP